MIPQTDQRLTVINDQLTDLIKPTIFAACDYNYFAEYGAAFCASLSLAETRGKVVIFPSLGDQPKDIWLPSNEFCSVEHIDAALYDDLVHSCEIIEPRAFYAAMRFLLLPFVSDAHILVSDIDCVVRHSPKVPDCDVGLFFRFYAASPDEAYDADAFRVAAGLVYLGPNRSRFVSALVKGITLHPVRWYCDQIALFRAYQETQNDCRMGTLTHAAMDWDMDNLSSIAAIITAKGARKFHPNFLKLKNDTIKAAQIRGTDAPFGSKPD